MDRNERSQVLTELKNPLIKTSEDEPASDGWDDVSRMPVLPQNRWQLREREDMRTFAIILAAAAFGALLAFAAWAMPQGRTASVPSIHIY